MREMRTFGGWRDLKRSVGHAPGGKEKGKENKIK